MILVEKVFALQESNVFSEIPQAVLSTLANVAQVVNLQTGEILFNSGESGASLFVIVEGQVGIFSGEKLLATLQAPNIVGEMAALDPEPRSATARALTDVKLLEIGHEVLLRYIDDNPRVGRAIIRLLCGRLRDSNKKLVESGR